MALVRQFITLFLLLISIFSMGQSAQDTFSKPTILFKITHPYSQNVSYLFGTHHAFGKEFFDSLTNANQVLSASDLLIKENLNDPENSAEQIINRRTLITDWDKYLSKKDLAFVESLFATSPTNFNKMTPTEMYVFLNRHFKQEVCLSKVPSDTSMSLDDYIGSIAKQQNIELLGLETAEEQIKLINKDVEGMPRKTHQRRLKNIIEKMRTKNIKDCVETNGYSNMQIDYQLNTPCRNTLILTDRNNRWMQTLESLLKTNNCFIAVGLSHLMYECGLINQIQDLGYTVQAINVK
ncbi:TraB/GumN family protein [Echinicola shivajiensis]|uniref:TraB/GumN family protein n=1 Tax=Echinicola shivajiensis TaxID=1035916 RepID=UPI001BFC7302|nr:TraB/GumN family protein [Echinicola shivajiensis]